MKEIHIYNETDCDLPTWVLNQIKLDAIEYFGESVRSIRIQSGIERHTFNAKTREVRFAFFISDYDPDRLSIPMDMDCQDTPYQSGLRGTYDDILSSEFDDEDDEGVLAVIDDDLEGITADDDLDLKVLDADFNAIDTADFEFFDDETLDA